MKKSVFIIIYFITTNLVTQPCTPSASTYIENLFIRSFVTNIGDLWANPSLTSGGFEYPRRTSTQIANGDKGSFLIYSGGIWLSSKDNGKISHSIMSYRNPISNIHFVPGPIHLINGLTFPGECSEFDSVWKMEKSKINFHIFNWLVATSLPMKNLDKDIEFWPGKGNKKYTTFPIEDDLAPFEDVNSNNIYDPEYGDYPIIKGNEAHFSVFNDVSMGRIDTPNKAIGVEIQLMTYLYDSPIENGLGTSLFHDCKVIKKTAGNATDFILSLYQDGDLGNFSDDYVGCDTLSNTAFMYNADEYDEPVGSVANNGYNPPILFTSFINKKLGAFSFFSGVLGGPFTNITSSVNIRNIMEGLSSSGSSITVSPNLTSSGFPITKFCYFGNPSDSTQWSMQSTAQTPRDIRTLMSSEKSLLEYNKPQNYNFVTYVHKFKNSSFKPNVRDSVIPKLELVKLGEKDSCNIQFNSTITPDTNNLKKGKIVLSGFTNITAPYYIKWSSFDTAATISDKDSGIYRLVSLMLRIVLKQLILEFQKSLQLLQALILIHWNQFLFTLHYSKIKLIFQIPRNSKLIKFQSSISLVNKLKLLLLIKKI